MVWTGAACGAGPGAEGAELSAVSSNAGLPGCCLGDARSGVRDVEALHAGAVNTACLGTGGRAVSRGRRWKGSSSRPQRSWASSSRAQAFLLRFHTTLAVCVRVLEDVLCGVFVYMRKAITWCDAERMYRQAPCAPLQRVWPATSPRGSGRASGAGPCATECDPPACGRPSRARDGPWHPCTTPSRRTGPGNRRMPYPRRSVATRFTRHGGSKGVWLDLGYLGAPSGL